MGSDLPAHLRQRIAERAGHRCEYCLMPESAALHKHEPDHIVPRQHGGKNHEDNLALACLHCNRHKGPNVGSFDPLTGVLVPLFNPRSQKWTDHFQWDGAKIQALTPEARVTVKLLRLNETERVAERECLMDAGFHFP